MTIKEELRKLLFEKRHNLALQTAKENKYDTIVWLKPREIIQLYGKDDFNQIENFLRKSGIHHIYSVENDGTSTFFDKLHEVSDDLLRFKNI